MSLYFELIQVAIGRRSSLSRTPSSAEWTSLYELSMKQAVAGVCFCGVQRLPKEQREEMPRGLMMQWFALAEQIKQRNMLLNAKANELTVKFAEGGFRSCVLKGQSIAVLYEAKREERREKSGLGMYRQSGDIDVWVDGERDEIIRYMKARYTCGKAVIHHIDVEVFADVPVEVHFVPSYAYSWPRYRAYWHRVLGSACRRYDSMSCIC